MEVNVIVWFANSSLHTDAHFDIFEEAGDYTFYNLWKIYHIKFYGFHLENDNMIAKFDVPADQINIFKRRAGRHLKGISQYILKHYPEYREYCVGARLLYYKVI